MSKPEKLLIIAPSDMDDLIAKGVFKVLDTWDENLFKKMFFFFPFGKKKNYLVQGNGTYKQLGWKTGSSFLNGFKITKIIRVTYIIFYAFFLFPLKYKKERFSAIRATDPYLAGLLGVYYSKIFKVKLLVTIHSDYEQRYLLDGMRGAGIPFGTIKFARKIERFVFKRSHQIAPIRESIKKSILDKHSFLDPSIFTIITHGIDFTHFDNCEKIDIRKKYNIKNDKKLITFAGRFSKENYIYDLLGIAKNVLEKRDDVALIYAGDGNEYEKINEINREKNLILPGFVTLEEVFNLRKESSISLCLMAGFSLIEACAGARPVISYDVEWHSELIKTKETGFLIEEGDIKGVVDAIIYLLDNNEDACKMGYNARKLVFERHDLSKTTEIKQNIYKKLLI